MSSKVFDQDCLFCKLISGCFLGAFGTYHLVNTYQRQSPNRLFTASAIAFIYTLSAASFYAAYEIKTGKRSDVNVEMRQSYTS